MATPANLGLKAAAIQKGVETASNLLRSEA